MKSTKLPSLNQLKTQYSAAQLLNARSLIDAQLGPETDLEESTDNSVWSIKDQVK